MSTVFKLVLITYEFHNVEVEENVSTINFNLVKFSVSLITHKNTYSTFSSQNNHLQVQTSRSYQTFLLNLEPHIYMMLVHSMIHHSFDLILLQLLDLILTCVPDFKIRLVVLIMHTKSVDWHVCGRPKKNKFKCLDEGNSTTFPICQIPT